MTNPSNQGSTARKDDQYGNKSSTPGTSSQPGKSSTQQPQSKDKTTDNKSGTGDTRKSQY